MLQGLKEKSSTLLRSFNRDYLRTKIGRRMDYKKYWVVCAAMTAPVAAYAGAIYFVGTAVPASLFFSPVSWPP